MVQTIHTYQITIYNPSLPHYFFKQNIYKQYLEDNTSKSKIYTNPTFQTLINNLTKQFPYTHYTIEML